MSSFVRASRQTLRRLARSPGSSAAAVVTVALGVCALSLAWGAAYPVLIRPLDFREPDGLVDVRETFRGEDRQVAPANYLDWRARAGSFSELAAYDGETMTLVLDAGGVRIDAAEVSGNFFHTLGVEASLGRTFDPALRRGGELEAVLSHALWQESFGGTREIVGQTVRVDDRSVRVIGILPADFRFAPEPAQLWLRSPDEAPEIRAFDGDLAAMRDAWYFRVVGRLREGTSLATARSEMDALASALRAEHPRTNADAGVRIQPLADVVAAQRGPALRLLMGAALLVLLVAAVNVSHLLLARSWAGANERGVRRALGASRTRLAAAAAAEGLMLTLVGGALGGAAALALPGTLARLLPGGLVDASASPAWQGGIGFALVAAAVTAVVVSAVPALLASRADARAAGAGSRVMGATHGARFRWSLVAVEAALALALMTGAGLLLRSLVQVGRIEPGFEAAGLWTSRVAFPDARSQPYEVRVATARQVVASVAALPGVASVGIGVTSPFAQGPRAGLDVEGRPAEPSDWPDVAWQPVTSGYLETLGVELRRGRMLDTGDRPGSPDVAVVNEAFARSVFPGEDALGRRMTIGLDGHDRPLTIVGVVSDMRNRGMVESPAPMMFRPLAQTVRWGADDLFLVVRTAEGTTPLNAGALRRAVAAAAPSAAPYAMRTGPELVARESGELRGLLGLLAAFGATALALGAVGIYGVGSFVVGQRRAELGLRLALGAAPGQVTTLVLRQGLAATAAGLAAGLPLVLVLSRGLRRFLVGVAPGDPVTLALASLALLAGTLLALLPAARDAARTDPARTLRE